MWFIAIGGFERSMKKLFGMFVGGITATSYNNALLGKLFMMKRNRPENEEDEDNNSDPDSKTYKYSDANLKKNRAKRDAEEATKKA
jgi:hypothetical protein